MYLLYYKTGFKSSVFNGFIAVRQTLNKKYDKFITSTKKSKKGLNRELIIKSFSLSNDLDILPKFVTAFFESNKNYYHGMLRENLKFDFTDVDLYKYHQILTETGSPIADDRKYTAEVQINDDIDIIDNVLAIILPAIAYDSPDIKNLLRKWKVKPIKYSTAKSRTPESYNGVIFEKAVEYLEKNKYL
jgi:hypothetical protein